MKRAWLALGMALLAGCGDSTGPEAPRTAGLVIWTLASTTDTVDAGPVIVYARLLDDALHPIAGARVAFSAFQPPSEYFAGFADPSATRPAALSFTATTDNNGEAAVKVWHGTFTATGFVKAEARAPTNPSVVIGSDSIALVTTPGNARQLRISPADTALYKGNSAAVVAQALDRYGNLRDERGTLSALTPGLSINGNTVTATSDPSRQLFRAVWKDLVDTGYISIVPRGVIGVRVLSRPGPAYSYVFASLQLDGSELTPILSRTVSPQHGTWVGDNGPQWEPGDSTILFFDGLASDNYTRLYRTNRTGVVSPIPVSTASANDLWPQETLDGEWVYFARTSQASYESYIYRCHRDGSQVEQVTASVGPYTNDLYPSPSPDGRYVVYATDRESYGDIFNLRLQIIDTGTGAVRSLGVAGTHPRWSPNGDLIVFGNANALWVVAPDGTGLRRLSATDRGYKPWASWSPDGKWIAAEHFAPNIDLIEVATAMTLPLDFTGYLGVPTWQHH